METTIKTGFTKSERLEIYKAAIKYIEGVIEEYGCYDSGICWAINEANRSLGYYKSGSRYNCYFITPYGNLEETYPEVYKYKPNNNEFFGYWFKVDKSVDKKRLSILREIVSELEQELGTDEKLIIYDDKKRFIRLNRDHLQKDKKDKHIDDITLYDFNSSIMSMVEINKAELIIFIDGGDAKLLKSRYKIWEMYANK